MMSTVLYILLLYPLALALAIAVRPAHEARALATWGSLLMLVPGLLAIIAFDWSGGSEIFQASQTLPWITSMGLTLSIGVDGVSMLLIALTVLLAPVCVFASHSAIRHNLKTYYGWLIALQSAMIGVFVARDLLFFYVCFEFTLVPMFVLISLYGSDGRKAAATKFFLYTFTGSVIALAGLVYVVWFNASRVAPTAHAGAGEWTLAIDTLMRSGALMSASEQAVVMLLLLAGFAVKVPLFPLHTWLPQAHTEAPTAGSVVLAGVLLKLGTYGIYRFVLPFTPAAVAEYAPLVGVLAVIGIIYAGLICWVQEDIKKLVAYSSVSHLGFCVLGLFALNEQGLSGSVIYMINHGLSTGGLFLLIGMMYERYHTRDMREVGGLASTMPVWAFFMVFFAMASVGLPGLNGFIGEFLCMLGAYQSPVLGPWFAISAGLGVIIAAMYLLTMVGKICFGPLREPHGDHRHDDDGDHEPLPKDLNLREISVLTPLAALCLIMGLMPGPFLRAADPSIQAMVEWTSENRVAPEPVRPEGSVSRASVSSVGSGEEESAR